MARQIAFDAISGILWVMMPLIIQQRFPAETRYFTQSDDLHNIPALRNIVAIQPISSAIIIFPFGIINDTFTGDIDL